MPRPLVYVLEKMPVNRLQVSRVEGGPGAMPHRDFRIAGEHEFRLAPFKLGVGVRPQPVFNGRSVVIGIGVVRHASGGFGLRPEKPCHVGDLDVTPNERLHDPLRLRPAINAFQPVVRIRLAHDIAAKLRLGRAETAFGACLGR